MSLHIHKFIDLVNAAESKAQKDVYLTLRDAKNLQNDILRILLTLESLRQNTTDSSADKILKIDIDGGGFKDP
jgi:hypothetical protein